MDTDTRIAERLARLFPSVDSQVITATLEPGGVDRSQPEWLWHDQESGHTTYGRWGRGKARTAYLRADIAFATPDARLAAAAARLRQRAATHRAIAAQMVGGTYWGETVARMFEDEADALAAMTPEQEETDRGQG